jgi:hypothetical protein
MDTTYYYNAFSAEYDEEFILGSHIPLPTDTIVHWDTTVMVTSIPTNHKAKILYAYQADRDTFDTPWAYRDTKPTSGQGIVLGIALMFLLMILAVVLAYNNRTKV